MDKVFFLGVSRGFPFHKIGLLKTILAETIEKFFPGTRIADEEIYLFAAVHETTLPPQIIIYSDTMKLSDEKQKALEQELATRLEKSNLHLSGEAKWEIHTVEGKLKAA